MILSAVLLLHLLTPYRPLADRIAAAEAAAIIQVEAVNSRRVRYRILTPLLGKPPAQARLSPGHRPPSSARIGLATFRRERGVWILQEQGREWMELENHELTAHPAPVWTGWLGRLKVKPEATLVQGLDRVVLRRFALRDLNAIMLRAEARGLRAAVAKRLRRGKLGAEAARSLRRHLLRTAAPREKARLRACIEPPHRCDDL